MAKFWEGRTPLPLLLLLLSTIALVSCNVYEIQTKGASSSEENAPILIDTGDTLKFSDGESASANEDAKDEAKDVSKEDTKDEPKDDADAEADPETETEPEKTETKTKAHDEDRDQEQGQSQGQDKDKETTDSHLSPSERQVLHSVAPILSVFEDLMSSWVKVATEFIAKTIKESPAGAGDDDENNKEKSNDVLLSLPSKPELLKRVVEQMETSQENLIDNNKEDDNGNAMDRDGEDTDRKSGKKSEEGAAAAARRRRRRKRCTADAKAYYAPRDVSPDDYYGTGSLADLYKKYPDRRPGWRRKRRNVLPC